MNEQMQLIADVGYFAIRRAETLKYMEEHPETFLRNNTDRAIYQELKDMTHFEFFAYIRKIDVAEHCNILEQQLEEIVSRIEAEEKRWA